MATTVGRLSIGVGANTAGLSRGLRRGRKAVRSFARHAKRAAIGVAALGAAGTAAGVAIGTKMVKDQMAAIDTLTKFADRIGIATERLVGLEHAAALTGNTVENLRLGLQRMARRVAEAGQGTGEAVKALDELGLSAKDLAAQTPDEQFRRIAEALKGAGSRADQVRLAFKLFDSEGVGLLNTLDLGANGLAAVQEEAERLGLAFSRVDAAKVEAANNSIQRLKSLFVGVARTLAVQLAPFVQAVSDKIVELGTRGGAMGPKIALGLEVVAMGAVKVAEIVHGVRIAFAGVRTVGLDMGRKVLGVFIRITEGARDLMASIGVPTGVLDTALANQRALLVLVERDIERVRMGAMRLAATNPTTGVREFFDGIRADAQRAADAIAGAKDNTDALIEDAKARAEELERLRGEADRVRDAVKTPAERFREQAEALKKLLDEDLITRATYTKRLMQLEDARDRALSRGKYAPAPDRAVARDAIVGRVDRLVVGAAGGGGSAPVRVLGVDKVLEEMRRMRDFWRYEAGGVVA